jgi:hypothetical protein
LPNARTQTIDLILNQLFNNWFLNARFTLR